MDQTAEDSNETTSVQKTPETVKENRTGRFNSSGIEQNKPKNIDKPQPYRNKYLHGTNRLKSPAKEEIPKKPLTSDIEFPHVELEEPMKPKPLMAIEGIEKKIDGIEVIANCSFKIYPKTITMILGNQNSGKTTILEMIAGLISRNRGNILVDDLNDIKEFKRKIGRFKILKL